VTLLLFSLPPLLCTVPYRQNLQRRGIEPDYGVIRPDSWVTPYPNSWVTPSADSGLRRWPDAFSKKFWCDALTEFHGCATRNERPETSTGPRVSCTLNGARNEKEPGARRAKRSPERNPVPIDSLVLNGARPGPCRIWSVFSPSKSTPPPKKIPQSEPPERPALNPRSSSCVLRGAPDSRASCAPRARKTRVLSLRFVSLR
jgi:hypothetical protein